MVGSGTESVTVKVPDGQPAELLYPEFLPGSEDVLAVCDKPEVERPHRCGRPLWDWHPQLRRAGWRLRLCDGNCPTQMFRCRRVQLQMLGSATQTASSSS
jgi:hypothetical protein